MHSKASFLSNILNECKFKTRNYPLAPEHMVVTEKMLSDYQLNLLEKHETKLGKTEKLFLTLYDKKKYIVHVTCWEFL
jgi:hypothetical protein